MAKISKAFKIKSNEFDFYFDESDLTALDLLQTAPNKFNCIYQNRSVNAMLEPAEGSDKKFKVSIEGEIFLIEIKDEMDQLVENMGFGQGATRQLTSIMAPMPGLVLEINVVDGQTVNQGDKILILEAMKMENSISVPSSAVIKKILVSKGQAVDRGQVMVELE